MKTKSAKGVSGCLIFGLGGVPYLRVIGKGKKRFVDYEIRAQDIEVVVRDKSIALYETQCSHYLDYNPEILSKR